MPTSPQAYLVAGLIMMAIAIVINLLGHLHIAKILTRINGDKGEGMFKMIGRRFRKKTHFNGPIL